MARIYNLKRSVIDEERQLRHETPRDLLTLPSSFSLKDKIPGILNQGSLGSCVSNAASNYVRYLMIKTPNKKGVYQPSRLFIYYNARVLIEGIDPNEDSGLTIVDGCQSVRKYGAPKEKYWPYDISKFNVKPTATAYGKRTLFKKINYYMVNNDLNDIKTILSQEKLPLIIGFAVYESFETRKVDETGIVPMPDIVSEKLLGGHSVLIIGYDDSTRKFTLQNSWGIGWGDKGFFTVDYDFILNKTITWEIFKMN
jgi:C1A family cysteine protease